MYIDKKQWIWDEEEGASFVKGNKIIKSKTVNR